MHPRHGPARGLTTPGTGENTLHTYAALSVAPGAAMAALLVQAQARRAEDPTYPVPRWLRHCGRGPTPIGIAPWDAARAADLARSTWTTVHHGDHGYRVVRGAYPGCPDPAPGPDLTAEEWGVLVAEALAAAVVEARALAGDTSPLVEAVALLAGWAATDRAMAAAQVAALLAGLQARAVGDDESDSDDAGAPAQPRGPPEGRDREFAPAPAVRLVVGPRRETVPWPPAPSWWRGRRMP